MLDDLIWVCHCHCHCLSLSLGARSGLSSVVYTEPQEDQKEDGKTKLTNASSLKRWKRQQEMIWRITTHGSKWQKTVKDGLQGQQKKDLWTLCYAEKTHHKIQCDQHDTWTGWNWTTTNWPTSYSSGKNRSTTNKVERNINDGIKKAQIKKLKKWKNFANAAAASPGSGHQWRNQEDPRSRTSWWMLRSRTSWWIIRASSSRMWLDTTPDADMMESGNSAILNSEKVDSSRRRSDWWAQEVATLFLPHVQGFNVDVLYRTRGFPWRPNSDEFASAIACALFVPFFFRFMCRFPQGTEKQIDYILIKRRCLKYNKDAEANDMIHMGSDHRCVVATFLINTPKKDDPHDTNKDKFRTTKQNIPTPTDRTWRRRTIYVRKRYQELTGRIKEKAEAAKWKTNKTKKKSWDDRSRSKKEKWKESSVAIKKSGSRSGYKRNRWRTPGTSHVDRRSDTSYRSPSQVRHGSWRMSSSSRRTQSVPSASWRRMRRTARRSRTTKVPPKCDMEANETNGKEVENDVVRPKSDIDAEAFDEFAKKKKTSMIIWKWKDTWS